MEDFMASPIITDEDVKKEDSFFESENTEKMDLKSQKI